MKILTSMLIFLRKKMHIGLKDLEAASAVTKEFTNAASTHFKYFPKAGGQKNLFTIFFLKFPTTSG